MGIFPYKSASSYCIDSGVWSPSGEELYGDKWPTFLGGDELVDAQNEFKPAVLECEEVEFRVPSTSL